MIRIVTILILAVLLAQGLLFLLWPGRVNAWDMRNLPVSEGPVLCLGDSLVEGVGASAKTATYPAQLGRLLGRKVVVFGVSGITAHDAQRAVHEASDLRAPLVVVTLGGNDILRGTPIDETRSALERIFAELQGRNCVVAYTEVLGLVPGRRSRMHRELCRQAGVILIPDIMDGVLGNDDLLADTVHPNDAGYAMIAERVAAVLQPYLHSTLKPRLR